MARVLYVVNIPRFFVTHRLPLALAAQECGYDVHVTTSDADAENAGEVIEGDILREEMDRAGREILGRRQRAGKGPVDRPQRPDQQHGKAGPDHHAIGKRLFHQSYRVLR